MALSSLSDIDRVIQAIDADGVYIWQQASKGAAAEEFAQRGFPLETKVGLDFCKCQIFDDPVGCLYRCSLCALLKWKTAHFNDSGKNV